MATAKRVHPLEGKWWFRFFKVIFLTFFTIVSLFAYWILLPGVTPEKLRLVDWDRTYLFCSWPEKRSTAGSLIKDVISIQPSITSLDKAEKFVNAELLIQDVCTKEWANEWNATNIASRRKLAYELGGWPDGITGYVEYSSHPDWWSITQNYLATIGLIFLPAWLIRFIFYYVVLGRKVWWRV